MGKQHVDTVIQITTWSAVVGGGAAATASMIDHVTGLAFVAWSLGGLAIGAVVGLAVGVVTAHLDRRDEIQADATARQMAQMFERQDAVKRRAA